MLSCFIITDSIPKINSGRVVAKEIKNNPKIIFGRFNSKARRDAYLTAKLADINKTLKEILKWTKKQ